MTNRINRDNAETWREIGRPLQILVGSVIALVGIALLGFGIVLVYADIIRDLPSRLVVNLVIALCSVVGILCSLVGIRLIAGRKTQADGFLFSPLVWKAMGVAFIVLAVALVLRGRWRLAILGLAIGILCLKAAYSQWLVRLLSTKS